MPLMGVVAGAVDFSSLFIALNGSITIRWPSRPAHRP
jgi:hypothetical protein